MSKSDLGDVCGRFLSSRLLKQTNPFSMKNSFSNEHIANDHKRHSILTQKLLFKPYKKNPLDQLRKRYSNIVAPIINEVVLTAYNDQSKTPSLAAKTVTVKQSTSIVTKTTNNHSSSLMMNWQLLKDRGSGLVNLGNTCFINASLQCLANTPPLVQWLLSNSHHQHCRVKLEKQFCLFCEAERILKLIHSKNSYSSSSGPANPNNLVRRIRDISKTFRFGRQEDASEFLICLIDKIIEACLRSSQPPERLRPSCGSSYEQLCHSQTFLHDLFGLVLRSRVVCSRCHYTSDTFEVQYIWIVGVRNQYDLRQSLQQFVCRETLAGENQYRCIKCKQLVPAVKRYTLHKASKILLINLKRFEFGKNSHKLSHLVRYPEYLNVKPYMSDETSNDQSLNYRLYAVLVHVGSSMHSGHYYSYVRSPNNRWYEANDTTMTQCDLQQVLKQHGAYILCYINETEPSVGNNIAPGIISTNKITYPNGKVNKIDQSSTTTTTTTSTSKFFTPNPVSVQNLPRQINSLNGHTKSISQSSNSISTNGNGNLSSVKGELSTMKMPKSSNLPNKLSNTSSSLIPSEQSNKSNSTPVSLSTTNNSNNSLSSISNAQSTPSQLKSIQKTNSSYTPKLNSSLLVSKSSNHNNENKDSSELEQPAKKKQRTEDSSSVSSSSSSTNSYSEKSVSSSFVMNSKKTKKKHKSHKHHHDLKRLHEHNNSHPPISRSQSFTTDESYRHHQTMKRHHFHSRFSPPTSVKLS